MMPTGKRDAALLLWRQGVPAKEIAAHLGINLSTVYLYARAAKLTSKQREMTRQLQELERGGVCRYSASCFTCPLPDCVAGQHKAIRLNQLPTDKRGGCSA